MFISALLDNILFQRKKKTIRNYKKAKWLKDQAHNAF